MSRTCITSATRTVVTVKTSFKQNYIIRLHIVDELDNPLVNLPYVFKNEAGQVFSGATDCNGFIEIKTEYYAEGQLTFAADALLYEMEQRRLRLDRKKSKVAQRAKLKVKNIFIRSWESCVIPSQSLMLTGIEKNYQAFTFPMVEFLQA